MPSIHNRRWIQLILLVLWLILGVRSWNEDNTDCSWRRYHDSGRWKHCQNDSRCQCWTHRVNSTEQTLVSCKDANLHDVPTSLPNTTVFLDLRGNKLQSLNVQPFKAYPNLINLTISSNELRGIHVGDFEGLHKLVCLSLRNNSIRYNYLGFQPGVFEPLVNLQTLNIQQSLTDMVYNNESYSLDALNDLSNLEHLFLDGIPENNLGEVFQNLTSLKELVFNGKYGRCVLRKLTPNFFPYNTSLTHITIRDCTLEHVHAKSFKQLTQLRYLDLSYNEHLQFRSMSNITDGLQFTNITTLKLNKVHKTLGSCVVITAENLSGLKDLNLKELYLESNRITTAEKESIRHIPHTLEIISVKDNELMVDDYLYDLLVYMSRSELRKVIISDQFSNHYIPDFISKWNMLQRNDTKRKNKWGTYEKRRYRHTSVGHLKTGPRTYRIANVHQNFERDSQFYTTTDKNKTKQVHSSTSHYMKRHSGENINEYIKSVQEDHLTPKENQNENEVNAFREKVANEIKPVLPETLSYFDASNTKIRLIINSFSISTPNNLNELNLSRNIYWEWKGPILGFENLTKLDMSWNSCSLMSLTIFQNMPNLQFLNLSRNYLGTSINEDKNGTIFQNQGRLDILDISENRLTELPKNVFEGLKNLTALHLARNLLKLFQVDLSHMRLLKRLNLNDNQLTTIDQSLRGFFDHQARVANFILNLEVNTFKCDCANIGFLKWISESPITFENEQNYLCYYDNDNRTPGNLSNSDKIYEALEKECYNYVPIIVVCTAAFVLLSSLTGAAVAYRYRWNIRYMYYMAKYKTRGANPRPRGYQPIATAENEVRDVNVSYADEDSGFIVQKLYTELEVNRGVTLYIRDRNAPVDERYICDNIMDAIEGTRKTLIIMSEAYLQHKWCIFEMNMAGIKALKTDSNLLCVLMLETVPNKDLPLKLMKIIRDQEFLEYPGSENIQDCFWDRLRDLCTN